MLRTIFIIILFLNFPGILKAQYKYSFDINKKSDRRVPIKYTIRTIKADYEIAKETRQHKRLEQRTSKEIKKHIHSIQTRKVKKRMRKSRKKAENYNRGKIPLSVKLKSVFKWKI